MSITPGQIVIVSKNILLVKPCVSQSYSIALQIEPVSSVNKAHLQHHETPLKLIAPLAPITS